MGGVGFLRPTCSHLLKDEVYLVRSIPYLGKKLYPPSFVLRLRI